MAQVETFDPAAFKAGQRDEWSAAAPVWHRWIDTLEAEHCGRVVTRKLVELAGIGPGDTVLDVAAGYGEPGLAAAGAVEPGGRVVCTDIASEMLSVAGKRAEQAGIGNIEFVERDAEELDFPDESFDAVISRFGLMFLPDVAGALERFHRFLKPHGRLTASVWPPPAKVQFTSAMPIILNELELPPPPAGKPGMFALADAEALRALVAGAGFHDVETGTLEMVLEASSPEEFTRFIRDVARPIAALVEGEAPDVQERVWQKVTEGWAPFTTPDGRVRTVNEVSWIAGTK